MEMSLGLDVKERLKVEYFELGETAKGTIEPRNDQTERLEEFTNRLGSREFHRMTKISSGNSFIPCRCIDGRHGLRRNQDLLPNSAGATSALCVADDLTYQHLNIDGTLVGSYGMLLNELKDKGSPYGGHMDSHAHDDIAGCGANDNLAIIYKYIAQNGSEIIKLAARLGVNIDDEIFEKIRSNAAHRKHFSSGKEILDVLKVSDPDPSCFDNLQGKHNEVVGVVNLRPFTTLDRDALFEEFDEYYEAFNIDAWCFEGAARAIAKNEEEVPAIATALLCYNLATALVLSGKKLRIVVIHPDVPEIE